MEGAALFFLSFAFRISFSHTNKAKQQIRTKAYDKVRVVVAHHCCKNAFGVKIAVCVHHAQNKRSDYLQYRVLELKGNKGKNKYMTQCKQER